MGVSVLVRECADVRVSVPVWEYASVGVSVLM